jgi:hypothetical protein
MNQSQFHRARRERGRCREPSLPSGSVIDCHDLDDSRANMAFWIIFFVVLSTSFEIVQWKGSKARAKLATDAIWTAS